MAKKYKTKKTPNVKANTKDLRARKKAAVMGSSRKKGGHLLPAIIAVLLVAGVAGGYMAFNGKSDSPIKAAVEGGQNVAQQAANGLVTYPVAMFADGQARHFDFKGGKHTIRYFIIKSSDGVIRAAFDACDVCWPSGKGYYQEGDKMVCRNCGRKFASVLVNEVKGGCNPAPLNREVQGDKLVIKIEDIAKGQQYFDFSGKV